MKGIIATFLLATTLSSAGIAQADTTTFTRTGEIAPAFTCRTIDGKTIDINKLHGKVIWINFFATWCPPCNEELPVLQKEVWERYRNNPDFVLVILGREHSEKQLKDYVARKHFKMPFAPDPERKIFSLYASQNIPRNIIIGKDGRITFQSTGYTPEDFKKAEDAASAALDK
jgi:peroxiredoxin